MVASVLAWGVGDTTGVLALLELGFLPSKVEMSSGTGLGSLKFWLNSSSDCSLESCSCLAASLTTACRFCCSRSRSVDTNCWKLVCSGGASFLAAPDAAPAPPALPAAAAAVPVFVIDAGTRLVERIAGSACRAAADAAALAVVVTGAAGTGVAEAAGGAGEGAFEPFVACGGGVDAADALAAAALRAPGGTYADGPRMTAPYLQKSTEHVSSLELRVPSDVRVSFAYLSSSSRPESSATA